MATKFSQIPLHSIFEAKGASYRKIDDLYFEDLSTGFLEVWNPMFDDTIGSSESIVKSKATTTDVPEFIVNPQNRIVTRNPDFGVPVTPALYWMKEIWEKGELDCKSDDYEQIAKIIIAALQTSKDVNRAKSKPAKKPARNSTPTKK